MTQNRSLSDPCQAPERKTAKYDRNPDQRDNLHRTVREPAWKLLLALERVTPAGVRETWGRPIAFPPCPRLPSGGARRMSLEYEEVFDNFI